MEILMSDISSYLKTLSDVISGKEHRNAWNLLHFQRDNGLEEKKDAPFEEVLHGRCRLLDD